MDLKVVFAFVLLSALAITSTHAAIPKCCISLRPASIRLLQKAERWKRQDSNNGPCDLDAVIVYVKNKANPICFHPKVEKFLARLGRVGKKHQIKRV